MMRLLPIVVVAVSLAPLRAQEKDHPSELLKDGLLTRAKPTLEQIFQFSLDGPRLKLERKGWGDPPKKGAGNAGVFNGTGQPIEGLFRQIQSVAGGGGSSMSVSNRYREMRFYGNALTGRVMTRDDVVRFDLEEIGAPHRSLEFQDDGAGSMRLLLSNPSDDILIKQSKNGAFTLAGVIGGKPFAAQAPSFLALYKQHRELLERDVLPVLSGLSIRLFVPPSSKELRAAVHAILLRSPAVLAEGQKLLVDLDDERFAVREKATVVLNDRFEIYKDIIEAKLKDRSLTIETERRLQKITSAHADTRKISQVIAALDLLNDPAFLVELLEETAASDRPAVAVRLEQITGQRHGNDPDAWKRWLKDRSAQVPLRK